MKRAIGACRLMHAPARRRRRRLLRPLLFTLAVAGALLVVPMPEEADLLEPVQAQGLSCVPVALECSFGLETSDWNGTGVPGQILTGTLTITNTGATADSYTIAITSDQDWIAEVDPDTTDPVETDDSVDVDINVLIGEGAEVGETSTIAINVTSQNDASISETTTLEADVAQAFGWHLICDKEIEIKKGRSDSVRLQIRNTGNGEDVATVTTRPLPEGLNIRPVDDIRLGPGANGARNATIEVGIALEEGEYKINWDLVSQNDTETGDRCATTLTALVGEGTAQQEEEEESPLGAALVFFTLLGIAGLAQRRRRK